MPKRKRKSYEAENENTESRKIPKKSNTTSSPAEIVISTSVSKYIKKLSIIIDMPFFVFDLTGRETFKFQKSNLTINEFILASKYLKNIRKIVISQDYNDFKTLETFFLKNRLDTCKILDDDRRKKIIPNVIKIYEKCYSKVCYIKYNNSNKNKSVFSSGVNKSLKRYLESILLKPRETKNAVNRFTEIFLQMFEWRDNGGCKLLYLMVMSILRLQTNKDKFARYGILNFSFPHNEIYLHKATKNINNMNDSIKRDAIQFLHEYIHMRYTHSTKDCETKTSIKLMDMNKITSKVISKYEFLSTAILSRINLIKLFITSNFRRRRNSTRETYISRPVMINLINTWLNKKLLTTISKHELKELYIFQEANHYRGSSLKWSIVPKKGSEAEDIIRNIMKEPMTNYGWIYEPNDVTDTPNESSNSNNEIKLMSEREFKEHLKSKINMFMNAKIGTRKALIEELTNTINTTQITQLSYRKFNDTDLLDSSSDDYDISDDSFGVNQSNICNDDNNSPSKEKYENPEQPKESDDDCYLDSDIDDDIDENDVSFL